ncbi:uncharacterized protein LOC131605261 [Vicia villosa]|uniref:uncharacterized protein LOC131605261 n=1 Tax=Vicia villosa TaxID=3911 RepID=UPI00273C19D8|nr:uncharacterized protein LOC131605261 [Vicia villosa]
MFWNCRGAASKAFYRYCKQYIDNYKPSVFIVVETRCNPGKLKDPFKKLGFDAMEASDNIGFAGGIVIAWKTKEININVNIKDRQFIHVKVNMEHGGVRKRGGLPASVTRCEKMRKRMDDCQVSDMETRGPLFTGRGSIFHGGQRIYEKLDRGLSNDEWNFHFPEAYVKVLPRVDFSDHHPILVEPFGDFFLSQKRPFRFESVWMLNETYKSMLQEAWQEEQSILVNLGNVTRGIDKWKFDSFDKIKHMKKVLMRRLEGVQRKLQARDNYGGMRRLEKQIQQELSDILNKEEIMWFQRSRTKWLSDGDRNTSYYHMKTVNRRRRNKILMLKDEGGNWIGDQETLKAHVIDFYKKLFTCNKSLCNWSPSHASYPRIDEKKLESLKDDINEAKVKRA